MSADTDSSTDIYSASVPPPPAPGGGGAGGGGTGGTGDSGGGGTPVDTVAPVLGMPRLSSTGFRAARSGPSVAVSVGTRVRYSLSEAATTRFTLEKAALGRKAQGRCMPPTSRNRSSQRCTRWVRVKGSFTHRGQAGANSFRFRGRVGGRSLNLGRYRLVARATDAAGNTSAGKRVRFRILR